MERQEIAAQIQAELERLKDMAVYADCPPPLVFALSIAWDVAREVAGGGDNVASIATKRLEQVMQATSVTVLPLRQSEPKK